MNILRKTISQPAIGDATRFFSCHISGYSWSVDKDKMHDFCLEGGGIEPTTPTNATSTRNPPTCGSLRPKHVNNCIVLSGNRSVRSNNCYGSDQIGSTRNN